MIKNIFERFRKLAVDNGLKPFTKSSYLWYMDAVKAIRSLKYNNVETNKSLKRQPWMKSGKVVMFGYDAKYKETLPYYDAFPLVLIVKTTKTGFVGLNLHYLDPIHRAILFDELYQTRFFRNPANPKKDKFKIPYRILKSKRTLELFKPAYKKYLTTQLTTYVMEIPEKYWETALFLPTETFRGAQKQRVWRESLKKVY